MRVVAFHIIMCFYGFWLPNDQRGSGSDSVRKAELRKYGPATKTDGRRSVAWRASDPEIRRLARSELDYPHVEINGRQALAVARGFEREINSFGGAIHALVVLPQHTHLVASEIRYDVRRFAGRLKGAATKQLNAEGIHPLADYREKNGAVPSPWARLPWVVYLFGDADVRRSIDYVERNPLKEGKQRQRWSFVTPWEGEGERGAVHRR